MIPSSKPMLAFSEGEVVVHPAHGVGRVERITEIAIAGEMLPVIEIALEEKQLRAKVPLAKVATVGLRRLASRAELDDACKIAQDRPRISRAVWARRSVDYMTKINSGQPNLVAEVVRDLGRRADGASYSERLIFERAVDRLVAELVALDGIDRETARHRLLRERAQPRVADPDTRVAA
ncbi:MAG: CarD family transcriptional regulator [Rhodospirillales bacterium]|nr:CarD family transcriptional regulator [Rhodospirillales bacterium]